MQCFSLYNFIIRVMKRKLFFAAGIAIPKELKKDNLFNERIRLIMKRPVMHAFIFALLILCSGEAKAVTKTWAGTTGSGLNWTLGTNWSGGTAPVAGDDIVFNTPGTISFSTLPGSSVAYNSLTISQGDITLSGASAISFTLGGAAGTDLTVASGASLTISTGLTIIIASGSTADISGTLTNRNIYNTGTTNTLTTVTGTIINYGGITNSSVNRLVFSSGSTYQHALNGGVVPDATWDVNSTCAITGTTGTLPVISAITQPFGNFTWNCPSQGTSLDLGGILTSIDGNFSVLSTNGRPVELSRNVACNLRVKGNASINDYFGIGSTSLANTMTVDGNFEQTGGPFYICPAGGNATLNVGGNFSSAGNFNFTYANFPATAVLNVTGNLSMTGGTFNMSTTSSTGTLNLGGNFTQSGGTITESSTGSGSIIFNGTGTQLYTSGGTISNTINFTVNSGSTLQMGAGGTTSLITGSIGSFTLSSGATLGITSADGISKTAATGNIQVSGTRTYSTGASYIYNGTIAQVTGDGLMQNNAANLTIDNGSGVSLTEATTISGLLTISNGTLNLGNHNLTVGSLTGSGAISNSSGTASNVTLTVGSDNTSPAVYSGAISNGSATSVSLIKTGIGTLSLSGTNIYTGATTVTGGILQSEAANSLSSSSNVVLNGGTVKTGDVTGYSQAAGTLGLQSGSTIALGTGNHTLTFNASNGLTWAGGATLTITGWIGTAGSSGTAGQIFIGSDGNGLTADQLSKITFNGYNAGAIMLSSGEITPSGAPDIAIGSVPDIAAGDIVQESVNDVIYRFYITSSLGDAVISGLKISTSGSYSSSDISNFKAWYSSDDSFSASSDILLSTVTSLSGGTPYQFPEWKNQKINMGTTGYIFITTDVTCPSTLGATINIDAVTSSDISFIAGNISGTTNNGGTQTVVIATPVNVTSPYATTDDSKSTLSWTAPSACYAQIMIVAKAGAAVTAKPTGDGSSYHGNLNFTIGDAFDGGHIVYIGTTSPETVTGMSNGTTYYYTFFTRNGSNWSDGITTSAKAVAAASLDFRSVKSGNWNDITVWEVNNGSGWGPASTSPTSANNVITILNGHNVTVNQDVSVDQVTVATGGKVTVNNVTLTIANGTDDDFIVDGTVELKGTSGVIATTGTLVFNSNASYIHNRDRGVIPTATWNVTSNCTIAGMLATDYGTGETSSFNQSFGNFTWNCPSQTLEVSLYGSLRTVKGNFSVVNTGTADFSLGGTTAGDLTIDGNYIQTGGTLSVTRATSARAITVKGNFSLTGGTLNMSSAQTSNTGTLNVAGNFTFTGGAIDEGTSSASPGGIIVFNGTYNGTTGMQTYTSGGTVNNAINFAVNSGAYLQMATAGTTVTGAGTFSLLAGATLGITSPNGITAEVATATGNIQTTVGRVFNVSANYTYNGTGSQNTGTGLPTATIKGNIKVAAGAVVTATNAIASDGIISVDGTFIPGAAQVISGAGTLSGSGTVMVTRTAPTADFSSQYTLTTKTLTALTVEYSELTGAQDVSPLTYYNLKLDNTSGTNTLSGAAVVTGTLTTTSGGTFDVGVSQLTVGTLVNNGSITLNSTNVYTNGSMTVASASGTGTATYTRFMPADAVWHYVSSPVNGSSPSGSFYAWDEETGEWGAAPISTSSSPLVSGKGYTLVGGSTGDASVSYTGSVVTSASQHGTAPYYSIDTYTNDRGAWGGGGWNLLGNPFTSAMDASTFIDVNGEAGSKSLDINYNAVYIFDGTSFTYIGQEVPGYPTGYGNFVSDNIQAGQGFFVLANKDNVTFNFTPAMQVHDQTVPMTKKASKDKKGWPGLQLKVRKDNLEDMTTVVYNEGMTRGLDPGYDIGLYESGSDLAVYTVLSQDNGKNFTRQALPLPESDTTTIAVGVDTRNGGTVTFSAYVIPLVNYTCYLEDRATAIYTDLSTGTYNAQIAADTYGTGRFYLKAIRTGNSQRRSPADNPDMNDIRIWKSNDKIIIQGETGSNATAEMYDVQGHIILKTRLAGASLNTINVPADANGVYIVIVRDGGKVYRQKIAVL
jgi:hypothetical protein